MKVELSRTFMSRGVPFFFWFRAQGVFKLKKGNRIATGEPKVERRRVSH